MLPLDTANTIAGQNIAEKTDKKTEELSKVRAIAIMAEELIERYNEIVLVDN